MSALIDSLATQLESSREVTAQVARHLNGAYNVELEDVGSFLTEKLSGLEDDEVDLVLSQLFTPKLVDQVFFANILGNQAVARDQWPEIIATLLKRPTVASLKTSDGRTHRVPLTAVTIERYISRLRLDGSIPDSIGRLIDRTPEADRPTWRAVARRAIWESDGRREILQSYLERSVGTPLYKTEDAVNLLNMMEGYKPADLAKLRERIEPWKEALRVEIETPASKPFFVDAIRDAHGGGRDQRGRDQISVAAKQSELEFLKRLQSIIEA